MPRWRRLPLIALFFAPLVARGSELLSVAPDLYSPKVSSTTDTAEAARRLAEAKQAAEAGQASRALQLATKALQSDPNEPTCRHVLGYQRVDGLWLTSFQQKQIARGLAWDGRFGWLKPDDLPRYAAGERRDGRRWFSADKDAARHTTIEEGWRVRTDNFQVTTNHSLAVAASLATQLEQLFQVWRQLFAGYHLGDDEVLARFAGTRGARVRSRPFNVIYHKTKQSYVAALRHKQPRIAETLGIYFDDLREAHFFDQPLEEATPTADPQSAIRNPQSLPTLYHEAVHQLFQESQRSKRGVGSKHNFWAVEGVATYFESLTPDDGGGFTIGAPDAGRLPAARRRLAEGYLVPLDEMASLSMADLQRREDLQALYSQMAAFATFLMHAEEARHREGFVRYLRTLYAGRAKEDALWRELGQSPGDIQAAYRRWLERLP